MAHVPLSRLMRVKRLTGLLPAIISTALQVSLKPVASCCLRCQPAWGATSLSVLSWLPESSQRLVLGLFLHLIAVIQAAVLVAEWRGRLTSLWMPFPTPPVMVLLALPPEWLCSIPGRSPGDGRGGLPQRRSLRSASLQLRCLGRSWAREKYPREGTPSPPRQQAQGWGN